MNKLWRTMLVLSVVAIVGFGTVPAAYANCENSVIEYLQISPNGTVSQGTWLNVHGKGNCGTSKIQVNGQDKAEIGNNEVTTTIKTEEFSAGNLQICYLLRDDNDGGWGNATRVCQDVWVNAAPPRPAGTVPADINTYCMNHGYDRGYCPGDGYSCICERLNTQTSLDMYDVCDWQTGGQNPYPGLENFSAPAWTCNSSPAYVAQPPASPPNNPAPSNPQPSNPPQQPSSPNNGSGNNPPSTSGSNPSPSGSSSPYSNVRVGDKAVVINSPSSSPLLCKSSAERGQGNVISRITNGSVVTILSGPYQNGGLYFWQVSGACNGYVADGQSGESWLQRQANSSSNPAPSNPAPSNPQPSNPAPSSGSSIPNTNARVGDDVQVVNSPSSSPLLCKSSAKRGQDNVTGRITNGSRMTIIAGPWQDGGLYFVQVTGACNGYVATGQSGEMWIEKVESNVSEPSTNQCGPGWVPPSEHEQAGWWWVRRTDYAILVQDLDMQVNEYLAQLASTVWYQNDLQELGQTAATKALENAFRAAGIIFDIGMSVLEVAEAYFSGSHYTAHLNYMTYRARRDLLKSYNFSGNICGNYIQVRQEDYDIGTATNTFPLWWATWSSNLPNNAKQSTCDIYPDTCDDLGLSQ